jgi:predicted DNA-binding transcriptional regulator YafY
MVGSFPYTPADYIEIDFDGDKININLPVNLEKTIGLNIPEWVAIRRVVDKQIISKQGDNDSLILESIKNKIKNIIPYSEYREYAEIAQKIQEAINLRKRIEFNYISRKQENSERRIVDPWFLFEGPGQYLAAYSISQNDVRNFRLESISNLTITAIDAIYFPGEKDTEAHLVSFKEFLDRHTKDSDKAEIIFKKSAYYNLSRILEIEIIDKNYIYQDEIYVYAKAKIIEENWFLDIIKSYGLSVIVLSPTNLKASIQKDLSLISFPKLLK